MTALQEARIRWLAAKTALLRAQSQYILAMRQAERDVLHTDKLKRLSTQPALLQRQGD